MAVRRAPASGSTGPYAFERWARPWTPFHTLGASSIADHPGVYVVRVREGGSGRPRSLQRCVSDNEHGIPDLGESEVLRTRLGKLQACLRDPHASGLLAG